MAGFERAQVSQQQGEGLLEFSLPRPYSHRGETMGRSNWITQYSDNPGRQYRWEPTPQHWRELEDRLQRWGGVSSWKRLEQLGEVAKTE